MGPDTELAAELERARTEAESNMDLAKRIQAEFDNYRKRAAKENEEFRRFANSSLISSLLATVDDLDRALSQAGGETEFVAGVRNVREGLMKTLKECGLEEIPTEGGFDPALHEAMASVDGEEDGMVADVYQKGYTMQGRVLRYAKVTVTKKPNENEEGEEKCQE
ncbi:MAG: nucleotide exchange factor GrpE [Thermoplasmatales archaeon]|nr:nucleotide exchange factor GrpE [Thermoplasmatales archaeon]